MNTNLVMRGANAISMFCRLNINIKKDLPIRSSEMGLLIFIVKNEHKVTSNDAVNFFKVSKPMIATMVSSLTRKEFITKEKSTDDKRVYYLVPTNKAIDLVESAYQEYSKVMSLLINKMGEKDYEHLVDLLDVANKIISEKGE